MSKIFQANSQTVEVYETPDVSPLTTVERRKEEHKKNDDIIETEVRPQLAFEKFAGKVFDVGSMNFSDSASKRFLYETSSMQTELRAGRGPTSTSFETPIQRFNRLRDEIAEFKREMESYADDKDLAVGSVSKAIVGQLRGLSDDLQSTLADKRLIPYLKPGSSSSVEQLAMLDRLKTEIAQFGEAKSDAPEVNSNANGKIVYELYYNPAKDASRNQFNVGTVDKRLALVEKTLGTMPPEKAFGFPDLSSALQYIQSRLDLLSQEKLDTVHRRIKAVMSEFDALQASAEKAGQNADQVANTERINEIFQMMKRWDDAAQQVPLVVSRLLSLKELHEEGAEAVIRMQAMQGEHDLVRKTAEENKSALDSVKKSLSENIQTMLGNMQRLDERFEAVEARMKNLK